MSKVVAVQTKNDQTKTQCLRATLSVQDISWFKYKDILEILKVNMGVVIEKGPTEISGATEGFYSLIGVWVTWVCH